MRDSLVPKLTKEQKKGSSQVRLDQELHLQNHLRRFPLVPMVSEFLNGEQH